MDVRVMVWWFRRSEAVWGCKCEMEVSGEISSSGEAKNAKDYSVGDGGQGVEGKGVKYVGDGAVMYRIIFSRC